jgi:NitT/TauT family transport system permease protein
VPVLTFWRKSLPFATTLLLLGIWQLAVARNPLSLTPSPWHVVLGIIELAKGGILVRYVVASLFRITWGYLPACVLAIPVGLVLGRFRRGEYAFGPVFQILRPISPLAWIPISILWFGVGDLAAIFLIFLASFLPLTLGIMSASKNIDTAHLRAARNFGLSERQIIVRVIFPAVMPQLILVLRIALGIAWLVVVAAEMIAVNSGLGFLIVDARNSGTRYDLVLAGMALIGLIGMILDTLIRELEKLPLVRWSFVGD